VFCEEIWKLRNCLLIMFAFRFIEPWNQKDKHQLPCVDDAVGSLLNLVDTLFLNSRTSHYWLVLCENTPH